MPKYLKGLNQAVAVAWPLFSPRAWRPAPPTSPRPKVRRRPHPWTSPGSWVTAGVGRAGSRTPEPTEGCTAPASWGAWLWVGSPNGIIVLSFFWWKLFRHCKHRPRPVPTCRGPASRGQRLWSARTPPPRPHLSLSHNSLSFSQFPEFKKRQKQNFLMKLKRKQTNKPPC